VVMLPRRLPRPLAAVFGLASLVLAVVAVRRRYPGSVLVVAAEPNPPGLPFRAGSHSTVGWR
jgi:hypothetical protein